MEQYLRPFYRAVLFIPVLLFNAAALATDTLKEVTFSGGAPLDTYQASVIVPLLTEAFKRNSIRFHAKYYPSLRSLEMSNSGLTDGELHRVYDFHKVSGGKYPNLIRIESKLMSVWLVAFAREELVINNWNDLKGFDVVYARGRKNMERILNSILSPENIFDAINDEQAFKILAAGRANLVIAESRGGNKIIGENPAFSHIKEVAKLDETRIYTYIHKKHKLLAPKIADTLEDMKQDGTFARIMEDIQEK